MRLLLAFAAIAVATAVVVAVAAQPKVSDRERPQEQQQRSGDKRFEVQITPEMLRHTRIRNVLYFAGIGWSIATMIVLLATGASRRMRDAAARITKKPFLTAMLYIVFFLLATAILDFPLSYYSSYVVPHQFDLSAQTFGSWLGDVLKGLAVSLVLGSLIGASALAGIRRVKQWWAVLWAVSIPLIVLLVVIQPIVLDPIFNKFEPLQDQVLRQKLLDLASRAGIEGGRVYQVNKSKQTKTMNAYVNGVGPTNRIVMWDTLLAKMNHDEVLAVMGHEMGHYVMRHIWKGLAFSVLLSFAGFFIAQRIHDRGLRRWGPRWGFTAPGDPASVPWLLLIMTVLSFLASPIFNGFSRHIEHQADIFSLELTHLNEPLATAFVKFAEDSKGDPNPNALLEFWTYSHPSLGKRIPFALQYRPWERGEENQAWKP
ncbi:MAG: M48 family metallopeptidase [Acidobacteriota bacterium]|nr:M48 family metallopeptidase [Acidobacteriota bacterium]